MVGIGTLFRAKASDQELRERMTQLPGIGEWTLESRSKVEAKQTWQVHKQTQESERDQYFTKETWWKNWEQAMTWNHLHSFMNQWEPAVPSPVALVPVGYRPSMVVRRCSWFSNCIAMEAVTGPKGMPWTYLVHISAPLQLYQWISMNINEHQWTSMNINEHQWTSMNMKSMRCASHFLSLFFDRSCGSLFSPGIPFGDVAIQSAMKLIYNIVPPADVTAKNEDGIRMGWFCWYECVMVRDLPEMNKLFMLISNCAFLQFSFHVLAMRAALSVEQTCKFAMKNKIRYNL